MQRAVSIVAVVPLLFSVPGHAQKPVLRARLCEQSVNAPEQTRSADDTLASSRVPGHVVGQVLNRAGQPLGFGQVDLRRSLQDTLRLKGAATDASGVFRLDSVPPGEYVLGVHALGYQRQWHALRVLGAGADTLCIRLRRDPMDLPAIVPARVEGQKPSHVPTVFVEGFRTTDSLTRHAASELRAALATRVARDSLRVLTTEEIDNERSSGTPDDWGDAWQWDDVRQAGRVYRADAIIDLTAAKQGGRITLRARRIRPPKTGPIVELPMVRASTLAQAVDILAQRLTADSVLMRPAGK